MRLGLNIGYWTSATQPAELLELVRVAEDLGYDVAWSAEAYGSDAVTILAWLAGQTSRIDLGTAIMQMPARTPAMTAMTAASLDGLSGGRFRLGLGVSGPQVVEGWHGLPYGKPLQRTREYAAIVRLALARKTVRYDGELYQLPRPGGLGKPLKLMLRPEREIPLYIAAIGPRNLELVGEIADGWLPVFFAPSHAAASLDAVRRGRATAGLTLDGFDIAPTVPVAAAADLVRPYAALYVGGMGSRDRNFYNDLAVRMGYGEAAARIRELYLSGRLRDAAAAVPSEFIDATALIGDTARIADRLAAYAAAGVTTLCVNPFGDDRISILRTVASALERAGLGE